MPDAQNEAETDYVELVEFVARNRNKRPLDAWIPDALADRLIARSKLPDELEPVLWQLLSMASAPNGTSDALAGFARKAMVVRIAARLATPSRRFADATIGLLSESSPPAKAAKNDRDRATDDAVDELALACVESLARLAGAAPTEAADALRGAAKHRSTSVRSASTDVLRLVEDDFLRNR